MFDNLKTDTSIQEETNSTGYSVFESDIYDATIKLAYIAYSKGKAMSLNLVADIDGREFRQQLWMTSGEAKGCNNFYIDKAGKKHYLPGFNMANALCLLTVGKEVGDVAEASENKTISIYNYELKKEVPTEVPVLTQLIGQEVSLGIIKEIVDKNVRNDSGDYVPSGETREQNEISKVFRKSDGMTVVEIKAKAETATFKQQWLDKNKDKTVNKAKGTAAGATPSGSASAGSSKAVPSLFGN